ncbi:MAG TPA: molybdopterin-dependent oxidoreductase [Acidobacteriaceae bacterium]|jgi:DMSO/TMAO reductase YedYZ molybdopterin-dependent catalytic subunit|nr:molybdopterin-dependent oxidoreductase [Acidobacteriaceae bacterium]
MSPISRRKLITGGAVSVAGVAGLAAAGRIAERYGLIPPDRGTLYGVGETLNYATQRLLARHALAREFSRGMISKTPFLNEVSPHGAWFKQAQAEGFRNWRLSVDGLVARPTSFSVADLKILATRSQITEVVCEEGWSYIAEWIGTPLSAVMREVGVLPQAKYMVYLSPDPDQWDSLDMSEARHPQTLLTWGMNDGDLPVGFGGPLRMRVPRQLGYKSIKYVARVTAIEDIRHFNNGLGSPAPPGGYAWYAGI